MKRPYWIGLAWLAPKGLKQVTHSLLCFLIKTLILRLLLVLKESTFGVLANWVTIVCSTNEARQTDFGQNYNEIIIESEGLGNFFLSAPFLKFVFCNCDTTEFQTNSFKILLIRMLNALCCLFLKFTSLATLVAIFSFLAYILR